jgi:hypothetical protein
MGCNAKKTNNMFVPLLVESSQPNLSIEIGQWLDYYIAVRGDFLIR